MESSRHTLDRSLLYAASCIDHYALDDGRDASFRILELSCQVLVFHFENIVIWELRLYIIGAGGVHQSQLSSLPIIALFCYSFNLPSESERCLRVVQTPVFAEHVHNLIICWWLAYTNLSFHAQENIFVIRVDFILQTFILFLHILSIAASKTAFYEVHKFVANTLFVVCTLFVFISIRNNSGICSSGILIDVLIFSCQRTLLARLCFTNMFNLKIWVGFTNFFRNGLINLLLVTRIDSELERKRYLI